MVSVQAPPARGGLLLRILPPGLYAGRASALIERAAMVYRNSWLIFLSGAIEPFLYLMAFQLGFGKLVTEVAGPDGRPMSYVAFVAPALLAMSAMNGAVFESTYNLFFKLRYAKLYDAMLATPIGPLDVALGEIGWAVLRGGFYAVAFLGIAAAMGLLTSWWALLMVPAALLVGLAFSAVGMALVTFVKSTAQFDYIQLVLTPMFLFSTTFFPLSVYPEPVQWVVRCFPLYHAIELMRGLATGILSPGMLGNLAYLLVLGGVGLWASTRRIAKLLLT
ncbi:MULTISPECIES: ABC transporter permease [unclassified Amycolatopsis]|uniref:ABC transporter permease n=1 Tax=unclassified Amycolatopsis TaxID=2618356 RepID=UPI002E10E60C|nr:MULTISPECIES: ABC transporter permease [unclassified Amycolatopsis]WSJ72819.1 ABC transporter permease [Amycolatopsis sp. NBC_01307]WSK83458.1 ABC transporter permease [Amycolatopsis sp. NBC_01286]